MSDHSWASRPRQGVVSGLAIVIAVIVLLRAIPLLLPALVVGGRAWAGEPENARGELQGKFAAIEREVARLRETGQEPKAAQLNSRLQHFRDRLDGKANSEIEGPELHLVGVYEGESPKGERLVAGTAAVDVQATGRWCLCSARMGK